LLEGETMRKRLAAHCAGPHRGARSPHRSS
jgi:hypothetical protein